MGYDRIEPTAEPPSGSSSAESLPDAVAAPLLKGERVAIVGRLAAMRRRDAAQLIRERGGKLVELGDRPTLIVCGDDYAVGDVANPRASDDSQSQEKPPCHIVESQFWRQLGMAGDAELRRYYTPAMLAASLDVPTSWVRRWTSQGLLRPAHWIQRLAYFSFEEAGVARRLAQLQRAGCTLQAIQRRLETLHRLFPAMERPLADADVIVSGRRLLLRREEDVTEPHGQLLLDFDRSEPTDDGPSVVSLIPEGASQRSRQRTSAASDLEACAPAEELETSLRETLVRKASEAEEQGDYRRAVETYRSLLASGERSAEIQFALAESLYRCGDLGAARERFYVALEIDEDFVEARASLGCVLAETGELELAVATFQGALRYHPDYADVHYHLAQTYEQLGNREQAAASYRSFLALAPESPWASAAAERLVGMEQWQVVSDVDSAT